MDQNLVSPLSIHILTTNQKPTMNSIVLPRRAKPLIAIAIADLEEVERDPNYLVSMDTWHYTPPGSAICAVCLAGSVIAKTLGCDRGINSSPFYESICNAGNTKQLLALDDLRCGCVFAALSKLNPESEKMTGYRAVFEIESKHQWLCEHFYSDEPDRFKSELRSIADELDALGF